MRYTELPPKLRKLMKGRITEHEDGSISIDGTVDWTSVQLTKIPIKFRRVTGSFHCVDNRLTSLENAPDWVGGDFSCYGNRIKKLAGGPNYVGNGYFASGNRLTNLIGAPAELPSGPMYVCYNRLTTLEGAPSIVGKNFSCGHNKLTNLHFSPRRVGKNFSCEKNLLTTLEGAPDFVQADFNCFNNQLTSLAGLKEVMGQIRCHFNPIDDEQAVLQHQTIYRQKRLKKELAAESISIDRIVRA